MAADVFTDEDVRALLAAVGADQALGAAEYSRSFEDLDLDSLARVEIASRVKTRFGIDIGDDLVAELSPAGMKHLVNNRLGAVVRPGSPL
ncbi:acyl carrier protein [Actinoplanes sp. NPDC026619]|uniref:acyl carrier protein n=1 Tax=Actinoplanes sp. NPDC026619 TaxID=3155798 RepID=UPI0033E0FC25